MKKMNSQTSSNSRSLTYGKKSYKFQHIKGARVLLAHDFNKPNHHESYHLTSLDQLHEIISHKADERLISAMETRKQLISSQKSNLNKGKEEVEEQINEMMAADGFEQLFFVDELKSVANEMGIDFDKFIQVISGLANSSTELKLCGKRVAHGTTKSNKESVLTGPNNDFGQGFGGCGLYLDLTDNNNVQLDFGNGLQPTLWHGGDISIRCKVSELGVPMVPKELDDIRAAKKASEEYHSLEYGDSYKLNKEFLAGLKRNFFPPVQQRGPQMNDNYKI